MTATNQQMTGEQLTDLSTLAVQLQAKAEANDDRDTAVMAYAVQKACAELIESRREFTAANATIHNLELKVAQVVEENAALKQAITTHSQSTHFCEVCGKDDPCSTDDVCYVLNETPATDAYLAEVRAQGVDMFAEYIALYNSNSKHHAESFAAQLRQGAEHE